MNKQEAAWAARTEHLAGFASPWSRGDGFRAYGYPTARDFESAREGFKGKRNPVMFHMLNTGEAGSLACEHCGIALKDQGKDALKVDEHSTWTYVPGKGFRGGMHYACSWSALFNRIALIRIA